MIKNLEHIVEGLLKRNPSCRDNDRALIAGIWSKEMGGEKKARGFTALHLLIKLSNNELTNPESVTRCRRKLQEINPTLRGEKYKERKKAEKIVKNEINNWDGNLF